MRLLHDREEIGAFLRRDPALYLYCLGDLEDFYWPYTTWYALGDPVQALVMGYFSADPVFLAYARPGCEDALSSLLTELKPVLPRSFYVHATPGQSLSLEPEYKVSGIQPHLKMKLVEPALMREARAEGELLSPDDLSEVLEFYRHAYPHNWFDPRMLESGQYFGIRRDSRLVAVAGVHVFAPAQGVAALGNIATHPDYRGHGLARSVTARLCLSLLESVSLIGLNVHSQNQVAIHCYQRLGFRQCARYEEFQAQAAVVTSLLAE